MMAGQVSVHIINNPVKGTHSFNAGSDRTLGVTDENNSRTPPVSHLESCKLATNIAVVIVSMTAQFDYCHTDIVEQCWITDA